MRTRFATVALILMTAGVGAAVDALAQVAQSSESSRPAAETLRLSTAYAGDRFFVTPTTSSGEHLRLFTATGGELFLYDTTVERLGVSPEEISLDGQNILTVPWPAISPDAWIPGFADRHDHRHELIRGKIAVLPYRPAAGDVKIDGVGDGMLGAQWFAGGVWTFDYPAQALLWDRADRKRKYERKHTVNLGFQVDAAGLRTTNFPRIEARVEGDTLQFVLDTGASVRLVEAALAELDDQGPSERAASFIAAGVFDRWRSAHPEWRVVENADANLGNEPMIEVPEVDIAGFTVGPVWFTRRADANFHQYLSQRMDRKIDGVLGGSALKYCKVVADYPAARAAFECA